MTSVVDVHVGIVIMFIGWDCEIIDFVLDDKEDFPGIVEQMTAARMRLA